MGNRFINKRNRGHLALDYEGINNSKATCDTFQFWCGSYDFPIDLDWCEYHCPKHTGCYTVAMVNDDLKTVFGG